MITSINVYDATNVNDLYTSVRNFLRPSPLPNLWTTPVGLQRGGALDFHLSYCGRVINISLRSR